MESPLTISREVLVNKILEHSLTVDSVDDARKLYNDTPYGLEAKAIYEDRYLQLADPEMYSKVKSCTDINEVKSICEHTLHGSPAKKICKNRLVELRDIEAIKFHMNCRSIEEATEYFNNAEPDTLSKEIYGIKWMQFHLKGIK